MNPTAKLFAVIMVMIVFCHPKRENKKYLWHDGGHDSLTVLGHAEIRNSSDFTTTALEARICHGPNTLSSGTHQSVGNASLEYCAKDDPARGTSVDS
jgi:hypothetical protein